MRKRTSSRNTTNNNTVPGFLSKTYKILENPEYADIIGWNEDGKAFKVKKPNEFAEKVLPKYFKTNNFASFVRQLNMYDFHKLRHDSEENEWRHKLFRRGHPNQLSEIKRKINDTQVQEAVVTQKEQKKISSDTQYLLKEMTGMKQKQDNLDKACSVLIAQNAQILNENKLLWVELQKKKEKLMKKIEKLFSLFLTYIGPNKLNEIGYTKKKNANHNNYLKQEDLSCDENGIGGGFGDDDDDDDDDDENGISKPQQSQLQQMQRQNQHGFIMNRNNNNISSTKRWDIEDLNNSLNMYATGGNNRHNIQHGNALMNSSLNGQQQLNGSHLMSSQNNQSMEKAVSAAGGATRNNNITGDGDSPGDGGAEANMAFKFIEGLKKNMKIKHDQQQYQQNTASLKSEYHSSQSSSMKNPSIQLKGGHVPSAADTFHRSNQDLLMQLSQLVSTNGANGGSMIGHFQQPENIESNNCDNADMLLKPPLKKMMSNTFNPNPFNSTDFDFQSMLDINNQQNSIRNQHNHNSDSVLLSKPVKKFKRDDDPASLNVSNSNNLRLNMNASRLNAIHPQVNPTAAGSNAAGNGNGAASIYPNNFSLEDLIINNNGSTREFFNTDFNNQRNSIDFSKFFQGGLSSLALPFSTMNNNIDMASPNLTALSQQKQQAQLNNPPQEDQKKPNNPTNDSGVKIPNNFSLNESNLVGFVNKSNNNQITKKNIITTANTGSVIVNPHQKSSQWDDFNQFISEQKIEMNANLNNGNEIGSLANSLIGESLPIIPRKVTQITNGNQNSLNNSLL